MVFKSNVFSVYSPEVSDRATQKTRPTMIIVRKKTRTTIELQRLNIVTARGSDGRKWPVKSRDRACCSLLSLPVLLIAALYLMPTGATGTQQQDAKLEVTPTATTGATQTAKPEQGQPDVGQLIGLAPASFQDQAELASQLVDLATAPQGRGDQELHDHQLTALEEASRAAALPSEALVENGNAVANATSTGMQADSSKQPPVYRSQPKHVENPAQITGRSSSEAAADDDLTTAAGKKKKSYKLKYHKVKKGKKKKKKLILVKSHKKKKHHHHHHVKHHHHHHHHKKPKKKYKVTMHKVKGKKKKKKKIIVVKKKHHHKKHKHASKKVKHVVKKTETKHQDAGHHHEPESHDEGGGGGGEAGSGGGHSHGHGKYYQYAEVPKKGAWKMGFKRGNEKHEVERKEEGHKSHFKTEFKWHDKKGKGQHIWDYNHVSTHYL